MTSTNPTNPADPQTSEPAPAATAQAPAGASLPPASVSAGQAVPWPYGGQPYDPFAPIPRTPRTPWIAPRRKPALLAIATAAAIVLVGLGVLIGVLIGGGHDRNRGQFGPQGGGFDRGNSSNQGQMMPGR